LDCNGAFRTLDDLVGGVHPTHVTHRDFGGQIHGTGDNLVLPDVFGFGTVLGFEHGIRDRQDGNGRSTETTNVGSQGVGQVVTIEVQGGDHIVLGRTQQDLLQHGVSNGVLDNDVLAGVGILELHPRAAVQQLGTELVASHFVAPLLEGTFGELHDVALVHDGHGAAVVVYRILQCLAHQTLGALLGYRLDADTATFGKADLGDAHFLGQELDHLLGFRGACLPLDTGVDVFGVLAEDDHVH